MRYLKRKSYRLLVDRREIYRTRVIRKEIFEYSLFESEIFRYEIFEKKELLNISYSKRDYRISFIREEVNRI